VIFNRTLSSMNKIVQAQRTLSKSGWILALGLMMALADPVAGEVIPITILQLNDVYEIASVGDGKAGGLARLATLRRELAAENPNTYTLLAGDCLSPSALGTAKVGDGPLAGRQMVAMLNAMGLDYATFGNHEFDLSEDQLRQRIQESRFNWLSSNVTDVRGHPFAGVATHRVITVPGAGGGRVRLGVLGLTGAYNPAPYVAYRDPIQAARAQMQSGAADIWIALTHQTLAADIQLAESMPQPALILGGHEHENVQVWRGAPRIPVLKADANVHTVYIHRLRYDTENGHLEMESRLQPITPAITADPAVARVAQDWVEQGWRAFRDAGFVPDAVVATTTIPLDGLESSVRNRSTDLTRLIAQSVLREGEGADLAIYNSGSIRIDDVIPPGPVTQYDVIRLLPFGGAIHVVALPGRLLQRILDQGEINKGTGGYLQTANADPMPDRRGWRIRDQPLEPDRSYRVALNEFLLSGRERGLEILSLANPDLTLIRTHRDIRFAVIDQLQRHANAPASRR